MDAIRQIAQCWDHRKVSLPAESDRTDNSLTKALRNLINSGNGAISESVHNGLETHGLRQQSDFARLAKSYQNRIPPSPPPPILKLISNGLFILNGDRGEFPKGAALFGRPSHWINAFLPLRT
jgi:hypothetical protein